MTFEDVKVWQFQKLLTCYKLRDDNRFELGMDILDIFEGKDRKQLKLLHPTEFDKMLEKYSFLINGEIENDKWVKSFKHEGVTYKVNQTPETWNVGQYVSMSELTKDSDKIIDSLHVILAVMCEKDDEKVFETSTKFLQLPITIAYPIALFFCAVMSLLPPDTLDCLKAVYQLPLVKSGDGTTR